jgi:PAS domain-containing protein
MFLDVEGGYKLMKSKLRILHLEDDPHDSEIVESLLIEEGIACELIRVSTRDQFRSAMEQESFDIILADYALPSFDGISALAIALAQCPTVPFILLSGTAGEEVAAESVKSGATDYVLKDRPSRLVPSVRRALREAEERRERQRAEQSLRESEERLRTIIQHMPVLMVAFDQQGEIIAWNRECENVTGYKADEMVGNPKAMHRLYPHAAQRIAMITQSVASPGPTFPKSFLCRIGRVGSSALTSQRPNEPRLSESKCKTSSSRLRSSKAWVCLLEGSLTISTIS